MKDKVEKSIIEAVDKTGAKSRKKKENYGFFLMSSQQLSETKQNSKLVKYFKVRNHCFDSNSKNSKGQMFNMRLIYLKNSTFSSL